MPKLKSQSKSRRSKQRKECDIQRRKENTTVKTKDGISINPPGESKEISPSNLNNVPSTHADTTPYESRHKKDQNAEPLIQASLPKIIIGHLGFSHLLDLRVFNM